MPHSSINAFASVNFYAFAPVRVNADPIRFDSGRNAPRHGRERPVKSKAGSDQIEQRRSIGDVDAFEQTALYELVAQPPLFDSQPVICPLQRQLWVFRRLDFDHSQAAFIIYSQKIND